MLTATIRCPCFQMARADIGKPWSRFTGSYRFTKNGDAPRAASNRVRIGITHRWSNNAMEKVT
jgi:hypothetical protein